MTVVLCGGGTAGHVLPNVGLIEFLQKVYPNHELFYIAEKNGVEKEILKSLDINKKYIYCGKFRRYLSLKNLFDLFKIPLGVIQSVGHLLQIKPSLIISKGGYVSVPVLIAGFLLRIPIIHHESDATISLTSKIASKLATEIWVKYPDVIINPKKQKLVQLPIRSAVESADASDFPYISYLEKDKPTLLVMGGSLGAKVINQFIQLNLDKILEHFNVIQLTGLKQSEVQTPKPGYIPLRFHKNIGEVYKNTQLFLGRAGANTLDELNYFDIPAIFVPLPLSSSRGEQFENARRFVEQASNGSSIINQAELTIENFLVNVKKIKLDLKKGEKEAVKNQKIISLLDKFLNR